MNRPEPDSNGMIPCGCCNRGYRKRNTGNGKPEKIKCIHCNGTMRRKAPIGYMSQKQIDAKVAKERSNEIIRERMRKEFLLNMSLVELIEELIDKEVL